MNRLIASLGLSLALALSASAGPLRAPAPMPAQPKAGVAGALSRGWEKTKTFLKETPAEIFLTAALGAAAAGGISYHHETFRDKSLPLAYSEHAQLAKEAANGKRALDPATRYLTGANDLSMQVFESWNEAHQQTAQELVPRAFAAALERRMDDWDGRNLSALLESVPNDAAAFAGELQGLERGYRTIADAGPALANSWDDWHTDHYKTVHKTRTVTDSDGNRRTEHYTEREYDYTQHDYYYRPAHGENAERLLVRFRDRDSDFTIPAAPAGLGAGGVEAPELSPESVKAIRDSRPSADPKDLDEPAELLALANSWATGSTLASNRGNILSMREALSADASAWAGARPRARNHHYRTWTRSDSGPREFRVVETALGHARSFNDDAGEILDGVSAGRSAPGELKAQIARLVELSKSGSALTELKPAAREVLKTAQRLYSSNFKEGLDIAGYRGWMIALWAAIGLLLGGLLGAAWDRFAHRYGWYD